MLDGVLDRFLLTHRDVTAVAEIDRIVLVTAHGPCGHLEPQIQVMCAVLRVEVEISEVHDDTRGRLDVGRMRGRGSEERYGGRSERGANQQKIRSWQTHDTNSRVRRGTHHSK